jgi:hypothetical protein
MRLRTEIRNEHLPNTNLGRYLCNLLFSFPSVWRVVLSYGPLVAWVIQKQLNSFAVCGFNFESWNYQLVCFKKCWCLLRVQTQGKESDDLHVKSGLPITPKFVSQSQSLEKSPYRFIGTDQRLENAESHTFVPSLGFRLQVSGGLFMHRTDTICSVTDVGKYR